MNIGITSSSNINPYASTLISKLMLQGDKPTCVIHAEKPKTAILVSYARKPNYISTVRKILQQHKMVQSLNKDSRYYLREYAASNNIADWDMPISDISNKKGINYVKVDNINSDNAVDYIRNRDIDILINAGGGIFKTAIIDAVRIGILNAHMAFLPTFRGMNVLEWSLFHGHRIGVTLHFIARGIDTGDILMFREIPIEEGDTVSTLRAKSSVTNVELMTECLELLGRGHISRAKQRPEHGKQYFVMHPRLKEIVERKLKNLRKE